MSKELEIIKEKIAQKKDYLKKTYGVEEIGVFGSVARGEHNADSDVDILVNLDHEKVPISLLDFAGMQIYLEDLLGKKVDLITKAGIKPIIKDSILRNTVYI